MPAYKKLTEPVLERLRRVLGEALVFGEAVKEDFSHDEMPIYGKFAPEAVCFPSSTEEVAEVMRICCEECVPVTVRGAGTGLVGGCVPLCGGLVLSTERMNSILAYDMNNLTVTIQPGVLLRDL